MDVGKQLERLNAQFAKNCEDYRTADAKLDTLRNKLLDELKKESSRRNHELVETLRAIMERLKSALQAYREERVALNEERRVLMHHGVEAGLGPGSMGAGGAAKPQSPAPTAIGDWCKNVARLKYNGETIGSGCLINHKITYKDSGRLFFITARHCLAPEPGRRITTTGLMAYEQPLRHLASFPFHDISVLQLEDSSTLAGVTPFELAGGVGMFPGMAITLVGFPQAADLQAADVSADPVQLNGSVSWLSATADLAAGDYLGAMSYSSGGALAISHTDLVGVHVGTLWHEVAQRPRDAEPEKDQQGERLAAAACSGGAAAATRMHNYPDQIEIDVWSTVGVESVGRPASGDKKHKGPVAQRASINFDVGKLLEYCVNNVEHEGCLGCFVPAHTLYRLLGVYHWWLQHGVR